MEKHRTIRLLTHHELTSCSCGHRSAAEPSKIKAPINSFWVVCLFFCLCYTMTTFFVLGLGDGGVVIFQKWQSKTFMFNVTRWREYWHILVSVKKCKNILKSLSFNVSQFPLIGFYVSMKSFFIGLFLFTLFSTSKGRPPHLLGHPQVCLR